MLEMLIKPHTAEKRPWKMFFIGLIYASLSLLLVHFLFSGDPVLRNSSGMLVVLFCVMFSLPYMYFMIKEEEEEDETIEGLLSVWKVHSRALYAFMWLFLGFILAFSFWFLVLQNADLLNFQIEKYCQINSPGNIAECISNYDFSIGDNYTGSATRNARLFSILENNVRVLIFTLIFSLIFGAGAIFILAWNASVIAAAISIFAKNEISNIPIGIARYMIHGFPEIAAYFVAALAGGMLGIDMVRNGINDLKFRRVFENVIILLFVAILILIVAAFVEVYITPGFF